MCIRDRVKGLFNNSAGNDVAKLRSYESRALAGFYVLEFDNLHNTAIHIECKTVSEIACCNHEFDPPKN